MGEIKETKNSGVLNTIRILGVISRAEFILPNLGSLIMGLAWGATTSTSVMHLLVLIVLSFTIINLSSAIGAQANTISDRKLDSMDERKRSLVEATNSFGINPLKKVLVIEISLAFVMVLLLMLSQQKLILLFLWIIGISLGCVYSFSPIRLKSRSWLAPISLILVLAIFPVLFAYYTFTNEINPFFLLALVGLALTIYGVIIPTEIRDFFGDKAMNIETMTVRLGLVRASSLSIILLIVGASFTGVAFFFEWSYGSHPWLNVFILTIPVSITFVLRKFRRLHSLSKDFYASKNQASTAKAIVSFAAQNPRWIMIVTQTYSMLSIIMLISKFLF